MPGALRDAAAAAAETLAELKPGSANHELVERALALLDGSEGLPGLDEIASLRTGSKAKPMAAYREAIEAALSRVAEAGEGGLAYRHVAELLRLFSERFARRQGAARRHRLRGPAAAGRAPARADRDGRRLPSPVQPPPGRRVPGHQPPAAAPDRGAARAEVPADGRRRRAAVDLRLQARRPRRLPRAARGDRGERRRRGDPAERQLPLPPRGDRRRQRDRRAAAGRLHAAAGRRSARPAPAAGRGRRRWRCCSPAARAGTTTRSSSTR